MTKQAIQRINRILVFITCLLLSYITILPYLPELSRLLNNINDPYKGHRYATALAVEAGVAQDLPKPPYGPQLVMPSIGVDGEIFLGYGVEELFKGIWHRPNTSTPDKGGNTVLVAHRWLYTSGGNTFYHLPKVEVGDKFSIFWEGKEYNYEVFESKEVPPSALEIEENTTESIVTLYTCTPLWTATNRYVVKAKLIEQS